MEKQFKSQNSETLGYSVAGLLRDALGGSLSRAHLYSLWKSGAGPKRTRIGRRVMILRCDAQEWLKSLPKEEELGAK